MLIDEEGVTLKGWKESLAERGEPLDLKKLFETTRDSKKSHKVWVDCTSGDEVGDLYPSLLQAHVAIVTPNKKFNARPYNEYKAFRELVRENGGGFYYETNVGAGLPILNTMNDLLQSGDEILTLEGIFSGTLSYLFNTFNGAMPFSELVRQAQAKGYTEPDPRDDLSGTDVARKLLILGREMGLSLELKDIEVESLVPSSCSAQDSVEDFYNKLKAEDNTFEQRLKDAETTGEVLRYVAQIKEGKARVSLQKVPLSHPFAALRGSDNVIAITTRRYNETPLVVQGPGAGPGVTAAGVFADILRAAHQFA
jgi:aspartokinase/homoserine dehydrogenase 1